jgi:hypothetical protein
MKIGDHVKVFLKGESPWAIVTEIISPTKIRAKIDNHLVSTDSHGLKLGEIADFELKEIVKGCPSWEFLHKIENNS